MTDFVYVYNSTSNQYVRESTKSNNNDNYIEDSATIFGVKIPHLFSRSCVTCEDTISCPSCPSGEECIMTSQTCSSCATAFCQATSSTTSSSSSTSASSSSASSASSSKSNVGAIAGGVVGGIAAIAIIIIAFLIWQRGKKRRLQQEQNAQVIITDENGNPEKSQSGLNSINGPANSRSSVSTFASSIFTRASNIIPIAYIPGVTIRPASTTSGRDSMLSRDSMMSDFDDLESRPGSSFLGAPTTAVRATPKMVTVSGAKKINESGQKIQFVNGKSGGSSLLKVVRVGKSANQPKNAGLQTDLIEEAEDEEEDDNISKSSKLSDDIKEKTNIITDTNRDKNKNKLKILTIKPTKIQNKNTNTTDTATSNTVSPFIDLTSEQNTPTTIPSLPDGDDYDDYNDRSNVGSVLLEVQVETPKSLDPGRSMKPDSPLKKYNTNTSNEGHEKRRDSRVESLKNEIKRSESPFDDKFEVKEK